MRHGGPRHHHTGLATDRLFSGEGYQRFGAIGSSGLAAGGVHQPFETVLSYLRRLGYCVFFFCFFLCFFSSFFPASFQLFTGPLGDISIRIALICESLPGIFFFLRCSSIHHNMAYSLKQAKITNFS